MAFQKSIRENGIVINKEISEARKAGESFDGTRKWEAKEEEYFVEVISCDEDDFDKVKGIPNGTRCKYKVDKETFDKVKFGDWAKVKFQLVQFGNGTPTPKAESFTLIAKNN